jgi:hypothetical protein
MKFDGLPGEKEILSCKLANGVGWLITHRLIIQKEKYNARFDILERQDPEMYLLSFFEKAEVKDEVLNVYFKGRKKAKIRLPLYAPSMLRDIKNYIEEAAKCSK